MNAVATPLPVDDLPDMTGAPLPEAPEPNPVAGVLRAMRGRWKATVGGAVLLGGVMAAGGYLSGVQLYESQAILRVFPQESNILYATGDDSVLRTFDSFVRAETTYVASHPVMARAVETLAAGRPDLAADLTVSDLTGSIEIRRSDSLIVLTTRSRDPGFAADKLEAVVGAYLAMNLEAEAARSEVRLAELFQREEELVTRLTDLRADQLEIGGEFGMSAISRAHVEKIAQIDALAIRLGEIETTLAALEADGGSTSVDGADQEIMRATLLDDIIGALGTERARLLGDLASLRVDFADRTNPRFEQRERSLVEEIAVVEAALEDRREQIRVLAQTGALTDTPTQSEEQSLAEIRSLRDRVAAQLETARAEARDLNRRRIDLDRVEQEIAAAEELLDETRRALEVIRVESGRALPGYTVLMSPPSEPVNPADDSRKMLAAGGLAGGAALALLIALILGLTERRVRFAETLTPVEHRLPVLQVSAAGEGDADAADRLRNELQLHPLRRPRLVGKAPVVAVVRAGAGETSELGRALAESYARARMKALFIEADLGMASDDAAEIGWSDLLSGQPVALPDASEGPGLWELSAGSAGLVDDRAVSAPMVRAALEKLVRSFDVIIVSGGSLQDRLSCQFLLSAADVGVLSLQPTDARAAVLGQVDRLDSLPRNGAVAVMRRALPGDPWLAVRT
ncbi:hypothetical protein [Roseicyclus persicicus]|uniref:Uncharacterized protein n=1 Tax=Roseicyclus persicicus TaxID=2650661 RepID=A0A7X6GWC6_9RHOB|nr:hypothetical protein [Roseibacterium persicicum]NKX43576.1 hypothetical protein [Roseibacterium persicicum]